MGRAAARARRSSAITGALLIGDLEHPERFWLHLHAAAVAQLAGARRVPHRRLRRRARRAPRAPRSPAPPRCCSPLAIAGAPLAAATAVYTAYLFAQAKARDLWQSPLLPPHLLVQALLAGAAALLPLGGGAEPDALALLAWMLGGAVALHLLFVLGEIALPHADRARAARRLRDDVGAATRAAFWAGVALVAAGARRAGWLASPARGVAGRLALAGLLAHEHAYVQAGQAVPLA